ncbi:MAG TPA: fumarylacetoacetase, partial [Ottowia sp.]|nr:fumarylacetoacetase [Ottowia sp.]
AIAELRGLGLTPVLLTGDTIVLRGWCARPGAARIGFGECVGTVLPARD